MATKKNNLKNLMSNSRTRLIVIITSVVVILMVVFGFMGSSDDKGNKPAEATGAASVGPTPENITPVPGTNDSPGYNALQEKANSDAFKEAQEKGTSNVPVLTNESLANKKDIFDDLNKDNRKPIVEEPPVIDATPVQPEQQYQAQPQAIQQPATSETTQDRQAYMQSVQQQITTYINGWSAGQGFQEFNMTGQAPQQQQGAGNTNGTSTGTNVQQASYDSSNSSSSNKGPAFVRAGSVVPAVMLTAINSDEPGPVLAQIVTGPLKGARLIGQMVSSDQRVVVQFSSLSMPGASQTFSISSFAIDPDTSRTGLATDVNNHYFLRYGLGLAAAFISGYGEAVQNAGSTTTTNAFGGTTTIMGDMTHKQIAESAFGKVGQKLGSELDKETNRAPTVTVASGTSIGVLFMADF
ncbi:TPA: TrbI/VirB10 family protein [Enterobacter hormaechei subsp. xiangfangensis]